MKDLDQASYEADGQDATDAQEETVTPVTLRMLLEAVEEGDFEMDEPIAIHIENEDDGYSAHYNIRKVALCAIEAAGRPATSMVLEVGDVTTF